MPARIAKLVPPTGDKHHSFQIANRDEGDEQLARNSVLHPDVAAARPFIQGMDRTWLMIEFWTDDEEKITKACDALSKLFKIEYTHGQFTREEIFD